MFSKKGEREYYVLYYIILFSSLPPYTIIFIRQLTFNF